MNEIVLDRQAEADVSEAFDFYFRQSRDAALRFQSALEASYRVIQRDPFVWALLDERHRSHRLKRFPFIIIYQVDASVVTIMAVAHASRRPNYWRK